VSGGFHHHLGARLNEEPFRAARLWRYAFDAQTDLVISRRAPHKLPTYATLNSTVDRLITRIVNHDIPGELFVPRPTLRIDNHAPQVPALDRQVARVGVS
jgi:hypothetical protein